MAKGPWIYINSLIEANWLKDAESDCVTVHRLYSNHPFLKIYFPLFKTSNN